MASFRKRDAIVIRMSIAGDKEAERALQRMKLGSARRVMNKIMRDAAKKQLKPAIDAQIAKVSPGVYGSGALKTKPTKVRRFGKIGIRVETPSHNELNIPSGSPYYPFIIERGGTFVSRGRTITIEPRRFMERARDQRSAAIKAYMQRVARRFIDQEVNRLAQKGRSAFRTGKQIASLRIAGLLS